MNYLVTKKILLITFPSSTTLVLWSMSIFLIILISGMSIALIRRIKFYKKDQTSNPKKLAPKGFR